MSERRIVVDTLRLNYQGLFNLNELYLVIDKWFRERGWDKYERKNYEQVFKDGRQIEIEIEPWKKTSDYARGCIKVNMIFSGIKDVVVKREGYNVKMNQGKVLMTFMGYLDTDYEERWESKAFLFFLRTLFDMYIYKIHTNKFESYVADETTHLYNTIKSYLNMQKFM